MLLLTLSLKWNISWSNDVQWPGLLSGVQMEVPCGVNVRFCFEIHYNCSYLVAKFQKNISTKHKNRGGNAKKHKSKLYTSAKQNQTVLMIFTHQRDSLLPIFEVLNSLSYISAPVHQHKYCELPVVDWRVRLLVVDKFCEK